MTIRRCPRCQSHFAPPARYCVRDGSPLVDVGSASANGGPTTALGRPRTLPLPQPPQEAAADLTGEVLDDRYELRRLVGEGGMARVYQAWDRQGDEVVAVKVLNRRLSADADAAARLRREAGLAQRLRHPNVCHTLATAVVDTGTPYLVMPFLAGEPLSAVEQRQGPMAPARAIPLLAQMCRGLAHAHEQGVLHRDLKPENVMLVPEPGPPPAVRAVVTDFGLAKAFEAGPEVTRLTGTGIVLGTPEFLSPEQVRGRPLDVRSDVFALGVLAFELLTAQLPFPGSSARELMLARLERRPRRMRTFVPALPEALDAAVARALTRDPAGRYPTMDAFAEALAPFAKARPGSRAR